MTIDEKIMESKKSIEVPPFDFDKARKKIEKQKENRIPFFRKKSVLILLSLIALTAIILAVVIPIGILNNTTKTIEIGFEKGSENDYARPYETQFETMIRTDTKAEKTKNLEVFYGNYHKADWDEFTFSKEQTLIFSLRRKVIAGSTGNTIFEKEIFRSEQDISYFFSRRFYSKENFITDEVTYDELSVYESTGFILYTFTLEPINGETIATVFVYDKETAYGKSKNRIDCYDERSIRYVLDDGLVKFFEPEKKEKINE